jgi:hypothetical protein
MSLPGYWMHTYDATQWLTMAQRALVTKNKVRKQLWTEFVDRIMWHAIDPHALGDHFRVSQTEFVAIQTFCLVDGKGQDNLSSDQLLNWCTTLADIRSRLPIECIRIQDGVTLVNHVSTRPAVVVSSPPRTRRPVVVASQTSGAQALVAEHVAAQSSDVPEELKEEEDEPEQKYSTPRAVPPAPPL